MNLNIEGESLVDLEEKIIALAKDIEERRTLLAEGCTCDLRGGTHFARNVAGSAVQWPARCSMAFVVCEARKARRGQGEFVLSEAQEHLKRLGFRDNRCVTVGINDDGTRPGPS